jgi:hypothetical protein
MATILTEALPELEVMEFEAEDELELEGAAPTWRAAYPAGEGEAETEAFFETLAEYAVGGGGRGGLGGGGRAPALGGVARGAAAAALGRVPTSGVPLAISALGGDQYGPYVEGEEEFGELEAGGGALEFEMLMEHFGHAAAEAETEAEMEAFIFPLLPLAAKFIAPKLLKFGAKKLLPRLGKSAVRMVSQLRRNPQTRPLARMAPTIVRRTMRNVARQIETGQPVTPQTAQKILARETQRVIANPQAAVSAYKRSRALDQHYHLVCRRVRC